MFILVGPQTAFSGGIFLMYYGMFKGLSNTYMEAARIDGANDYTVMLKIMFPMAFNMYLAHCVLGFVSCWNSYETFLIWLPGYATLSYGMYDFQYYAALYEATMPEILAGFVVVMIPTATLYLIAQKGLLKNLTMGGLKY